MADFEAPPSPIARFRYLVVSAVLALMLQGWRRSGAVREVAGHAHLDGSVLRQVSERTVWRWLAAYERDGLAGLEPSARPRVADSVVLPERFLEYLRHERTTDPDASVPELIRRGRLSGVLHPNARIDRSTVWRAMGRMGLDTRRRRPPHGDDTRRFAYSERMQLVLVDFKHFRAGPTRKKRVAIYFLDDATRYGLGVQVAAGSGEPADVVLRALAELLRRYGRMDALYWDHGSGFIAEDSALVCAQLGIPALFGAVAYPEGRGKIERFNRSAKARILRALDGAKSVDADCGALTLRLRHDLFEVYQQLPHESLGGDTPHQRWTESGRGLRPVESEAWLQERFTVPWSAPSATTTLFPTMARSTKCLAAADPGATPSTAGCSRTTRSMPRARTAPCGCTRSIHTSTRPRVVHHARRPGKVIDLRPRPLRCSPSSGPTLPSSMPTGASPTDRRRTTMSNTTDLRAHFGLTAMPFTRELTVRQCWRSPQLDEVLQEILMTVHNRMSAGLIAPAGTGKTTLLRCVQSHLPEARYQVHYVKVTALSQRDFCRELSEAIGAAPAATYNGLVRRIQERLVTLLEQDSLRPVLIIDEAHDMRPEVLAILRVLTNFEMDSRLVVSVLLAGQGPLKVMLARQELESVRRRLAHVATLRLLSRDETMAYVRHRLSVAGKDGDLFDLLAHDAIYEMTNGNLRAIDRVALKALELAAREGKSTLGAEYLAAAAHKLML